MFKTISAALLAVSVLAAPALAAGKTEAPIVKSTQVKTTPAKIVNKTAMKPSVLNANARMGRHHHSHYRHHHRHMGAIKGHSKISFKPATSQTKRG